MKKTIFSDSIFILVLVLIFIPFVICEPLYVWFKQASASHAFLMGFLKFAVLATMGEMLGLRIRKGVYNEAGFGIVPRAVVWGFLGVAITAAMMTFKAGAPILTDYLFGTNTQHSGAGFAGSVGRANGTTAFFFSASALLKAFSISVMMNCIFAPVFMTFHKITDTQIVQTGGTLKGFFSNRINFSTILQNLNWTVQWKFVFLKTIPFFWIPAHTITFILPNEFQVLFAAILGVVLGVILSIAANKK
ncbi:MAG: hypothetical protein LBU91_04860 [Bacteroidales bacterium]|jgi:hypothetical protein|nr:hypothetical protein [Bacteroidales bacterium]